MAEEKGFEPLHRFPGLRDFESRLFDHLSTPPDTALIISAPGEKINPFLGTWGSVAFHPAGGPVLQLVQHGHQQGPLFLA